MVKTIENLNSIQTLGLASSWSRNLRQVAKSGIAKSKSAVNSVSRFFKKSDLSALDTVTNKIELKAYNKIGGSITNEISIGDVPFRKVAPDFRAGNFNTAFKKAKIPQSVPSNVQNSAKSILKRTNPEVGLSDQAITKSNLKVSLKDLDVPANANLTPKQFNKMKSLISQSNRGFSVKKFLISKFTTLAIAGGLTAGALQLAANQRNGCWSVLNSQGNLSYCKLNNRTCNKGNMDTGGSCSLPKAGNVIQMVSRAKIDTNLKAKIENQCGTIDFDNFNNYISRNSDKLIDIFNETELNYDWNACEYPGAKISGCAMCDSTAEPLSNEYYDQSRLADNVTLQCVQNSGMLDVINDLTNVGKGVLPNLWGNIRYYVIGIICFITLMFGLSFLRR